MNGPIGRFGECRLDKKSLLGRFGDEANLLISMVTRGGIGPPTLAFQFTGQNDLSAGGVTPL
jgi:hypothetical protein